MVLEAGIAASSVGWARVLPGIAQFARVCAYDRPGFAWSEPSCASRTTAQFIRDLRNVVAATGEPVILVGHSFGGLLVRLYAAQYPVRGLVLVDPALTQEWADPSPRRLAMLRRGIRLSKRGAWLAQLGIVRGALTLTAAGAAPIAKLVAHLSSGRGGAATTGRLVGEVTKLPRELLPVIQSHWCKPECFRSMAAHLAALPLIAAEAARTQVPASVPVIVISGGHLTPEQLREHQQLATRRHVVAHASGHWVHLDAPGLIIDAVRELASEDHG